MAHQLHGTDHILRKKVLIEINEDFHRADFVIASLKAPILPELIACLKEEDDSRRELASSAVMKVAGTELGRQKLVAEGHLKDLKILLRDKVPSIRANAYHALMFIAEYRAEYEAVVESGLLPTLVDLLKEEKEKPIITLALSLLKELCEAETSSKTLLKTKILKRLNKHLNSDDLNVRRQAVANIAALSFKLKGKKQIILCNIITMALKLINQK